jgi:hypothetical protein
MSDDDPLAAHRKFCSALWSEIMTADAAIGEELRRRQQEDMRFDGGRRPARPTPTPENSWAAERKAELRMTSGMGIR